MTCPICGQGDVYRAIEKLTEETLYICDECEAIWFSINQIADAVYLQYSFYMMRRGFRPHSKHLTFFEKISCSQNIDTRIEQPKVVRLDCNGRGMILELMKIPSGTFIMGSPRTEEKRSVHEIQHRVIISRSFYMGSYEVTQAQYQSIMKANPSLFRGDNLPVEAVTWHEAVEFCRRLSLKVGRKIRLPTEAEWEYSCRAGTTTAFNTGKTIDYDLANYVSNWSYDGGRKKVCRGTPTPVGSFPPNAWGLYDMHGNVWEWCSDGFREYNTQDCVDPREELIDYTRVLRGGSWDSDPSLCRSASRMAILSDFYHICGFRIVME